MRKIIKITPVWTFISISIIVPLMAFIIETWWEHYQSPPVLNILFSEKNMDGYIFQDQAGRIVTPASWKNKVTVVDFFFTSCPSICPTLTRNMKRLQDAFNKTDTIVRFLSFSVDPVRDSAQKLKKYADKYGVNHDTWWMLTGDKEEIYDIAKKEFKANLFLT